MHYPLHYLPPPPDFINLRFTPDCLEEAINSFILSLNDGNEDDAYISVFQVETGRHVSLVSCSVFVWVQILTHNHSFESKFLCITNFEFSLFFALQKKNWSTFAHPYSWQHYLHCPKGRSNPNVHRQMNRENVVIIYDVILHNLKKEGNLVIWYSVDDPWGHHDDKVSQSQKDKYCSFTHTDMNPLTWSI